MLRASATGLAALVLALLPLALTGCLYDQPLTAASNVTSPNIDTRLLGVFEMVEKATKPGEEDTIHRVAVLPGAPTRGVIGAGVNTYLIYYRDFSKKPAEVLRFKGWLSRVGSENFLSFEDVATESKTFGKFGFFRYEWEFPGNIVLTAPDLNDAASVTSPYQLRRALRAKLKANTAFPFQPTFWRKIARIWWDEQNPEPQTTLPPEFEKGTTLDKPAL